MIGREAYHNPYWMASCDARYYDTMGEPKLRSEIVEAMLPYIRFQLEQHGGAGLKLNSITRHMLGLAAGMPGARAIRHSLFVFCWLCRGVLVLLLVVFVCFLSLAV